MIEVTYDNVCAQSVTNRIICKGALDRGWSVRVPVLPSPHIFINRGDDQPLHLFSATPPSVSFAQAHLVNDKYATYVVLSDNDIPQLDTMIAAPDDICTDAIAFMRTHGKIVTKPVDGGHGNGITVNVQDEDTLRAAMTFAAQHSKSGKAVLLQQQFTAEAIIDVRIAVIAGKSVAAIERVPARVIGDGMHTVEQLVAIENKSSDRGEPYRAKLATIDIDRVRTYLGNKVYDVPQQGAYYTVLGIANYGAGGELVDVTDDVPEWLLREAEHVADVLELDVAGVDYMIDKKMTASMDRTQVRAVVTEVNKCPALAMHDEPTVGNNRHTIDKYLDFIAQL